MGSYSSMHFRQYLNALNDKRDAKTLADLFEKFFGSDTIAAAGTNQATGTAVAAANVAVTGADGTKGVRLQIPSTDDVVRIINTDASNALKIYPALGGQINALGANAAYTLAAAQEGYFVARSPTQWYTGIVGATSAQIAYLTGAAAGTGAVSKCVVLDASGDFSMPDDGHFKPSYAALAAAGAAQATFAAIADQNVAVTGADGTKGVALPAAAVGLEITVWNTAADKVLNISPVNGGNDAINALTAGTGVFALAPGEAVTFVATSATQWYTRHAAGQTPGTASAYLPAVLGANKNLDTLVIADGGLKLGSGAGTAIAATAAEVNAVADASARIVTTTATTLALTVTQHAERVVLINTNSTFANTFSLPAASGSGVKFTLINNIAQTAGSIVVAANGTDVMNGVAFMFGTTTAAAEAFLSSASSDKVSFNRTTQGGLGGDIVEAWDVAANTWTVQIKGVGSGSLATPFSES